MPKPSAPKPQRGDRYAEDKFKNAKNLPINDQNCFATDYSNRGAAERFHTQTGESIMPAIKKHSSSVLAAVIASSFLFGIFTLYTASESSEMNTDYNLPASSSNIESYLRSITSSLRSIESTLNRINNNLSSINSSLNNIESYSQSSKSYLYDIEDHLDDIEYDVDDVESYLQSIERNTD